MKFINAIALKAGHFLVVVRTRRFPVIEANDPPLPEPRALWTAARIELPLEGVDEIRSHDLATLATREHRVVLEIHALLDADPIGQEVGGNLWPAVSKIGLQLVGPREVLVGEQGVVGIQDHVVGVHVGGLDGVERGGRLVEGITEGFHTHVVHRA